eukprot:scaffold224818_cov33-Tisochrysis_lutea.AAC.4
MLTAGNGRTRERGRRRAARGASATIAAYDAIPPSTTVVIFTETSPFSPSLIRFARIRSCVAAVCGCHHGDSSRSFP